MKTIPAVAAILVSTHSITHAFSGPSSGLMRNVRSSRTFMSELDTVPATAPAPESTYLDPTDPIPLNTPAIVDPQNSGLEFETFPVPAAEATYLDPTDPIPVVSQKIIGSILEEDSEVEAPAVASAFGFTSWGAETPTKKPDEGRASQALPFLPAPAVLDGSMPGDNGFDPLRLASDKATLIQYREAEIKHARLAMLAAAGWPLSETFNPFLSSILNMPSITAPMGGRVPSVLNGGLDQVSIAYWFSVLAFASAVEVYTGTLRDNEPGDLGFDPLGIYRSTDAAGKRDLQDKELANGRLAMMAIFGFAVQEFLYKIPVIDETPIFFKPGFLLFQPDM